MTNMNDILGLLGSQPRVSKFISSQSFIVDKVEFLSVAESLQENTAYVTNMTNLEEELTGKDVSPRSLIVCASDGISVQVQDLPHANIVIFDAELLHIFTLLNQRMREYSSWQVQLLTCVHEYGTLSSIAEVCSKICRSPVYILNADRQIAVSAGTEYSPQPYAQQLATQGLSYWNLDSCPTVLLHEGHRGLRLERAELSWYEGMQLHLWSNIREGENLFFLMIEQSAASQLKDFDMLAYFACISIFRVRERFVATRESTKFSFQTVMSDILSGRMTKRDQIEQSLNSAGILTPTDYSYRLILSKPITPRRDIVGFSTKLEELFPGGGSYGVLGSVLYLWPVIGELPEHERIEKLFQDFGFTGIIGDENHSQNLRMEHKILEQSLQLKPRAFWLRNRAVCYYDELRLLNIVDILYTAAPDFYGVKEQDAVRHLVPPAVEKVTQYDKMHKSNLRDVLRTYLSTNCNLSDTAARLYMHKNTILYKIKQINEVAQVDLKDGRTNIKLLIGCAILEYLESQSLKNT